MADDDDKDLPKSMNPEDLIPTKVTDSPGSIGEPITDDESELSSDTGEVSINLDSNDSDDYEDEGSFKSEFSSNNDTFNSNEDSSGSEYSDSGGDAYFKNEDEYSADPPPQYDDDDSDEVEPFPVGGGPVPSSISAIVKKPTLGVNQKGAGAGITGLLGFLGLFVISLLFFMTENYFISMLTISIGLMIYVAGLDTVKIILSSFTVSFSSRHLIDKAAFLVDTLDALNKILSLAKSKSGEVKLGPLHSGTTIELPNNMLSKDIQKLIQEGKDFEYAQYVLHSYYAECHELYDYSTANLEFVADAMPLFGLIGTIIGLIAMFDGLGANVSIESLTPQLALALKTTLYGAVFSSFYKIVSSRFEQRLKALEYDYETIYYALEVLIRNKNQIEVKS